MKRLALLILLIAVVPFESALAQTEGANNARGFEPGKVYDFFGLDSVDPFSGNLNVRIPLQSHEIRPGFGVSFFLSHNGKLWDYIWLDDGRAGVPEVYSNCGFGWLFTLGRVLPPQYGNPWTYLSPDGAHHPFSGSGDGSSGGYTNDGSYMRLRLTPANVQPQYVTSMEVDTPDGLVHTFRADGQLTEIRDLYGNWVRVNYAANGDWEISEGYGEPGQELIARTHKVTFEVPSLLPPVGNQPPQLRYFNPNFQKRVKTIELASFPQPGQQLSQARAVYTLNYEDTTIDNGSCAYPYWPPPPYNVPLLTRIDLPDGSSYEPRYNRVNTGACDSGTLKELRLPTMGLIGWAYGNYQLPREQCIVSSSSPPAGLWYDNFNGVTRRRLKAHDDSLLEETWYEPTLMISAGTGTISCTNEETDGTYRNKTFYNAPLPPKVFRNRRTSKSDTITNHYTDHFFSVMRSPEHSGADAVVSEYGLALTRTEMLDGIPLSTKTFAANGLQLRTTHRSFETDDFDGSDVGINPRVNITRTVFNDDTGDCKNSNNDVVPCWVQQASSGFDGVGHYRTQTTTSNFPEVGTGCASHTRTTFVNFSGGSSNPWLLNTYTDSSVEERCQTGSTITTQTRSAITTFEPGKGTIRSVQTGTGTGALLSATCRNARGFITSQRWFGGDGRSVPSDPCSTSRSTAEYFLTFTNTFTGAKLTSRTAKWDGTTHNVIDETLDPNTGLASSTRDSAGRETNYEFDSSGRIAAITPPGIAKTRYVPGLASVSGGILTPASVSVDTNFSSIRKDYQYDSLGRLWREKMLMPDGTWSLRETLFDNRGNKASVSGFEELVIPTGGTEYDFHPQFKTVFSGYDVFDRPTTITAPDNTYTSFAYFGSRKIRRHAFVNTPPSEQITTEKYDALGRLRSVSEAGDTIVTTYGYDPGDHLSSVEISSGSSSQTRAFNFDTRGLLSSERHPELGAAGNGITTYSEYDARGHAHRNVTGSGGGAVNVALDYDPAERLTAVRDSGGTRVLKEYFFGDDATLGAPANTVGKLWKARRHNYIPGVPGDTLVTETYNYGSNALVSTKDTTVESAGTPLQTFAQSYAYDNLGEPIGLTYPTCPSCPANGGIASLSRTFAKGRLTSVGSYASSITYNPSGMLREVNHAGGVVDVYEDDRAMGRLSKIEFKGCPTSVTIVPQQTSMCVNASNSASVTPVAGATYAWTIDSGTLTPPSTGSSVTFTSASPGTAVLHVSVSVDDCTLSAEASVVVTASPTISSGSPADPMPIGPGETTTLTVSASGSNLSYQWYQGTAPNQSQPMAGATAASFITPPLLGTTSYWVRVASSCGSVNSRTATVTVLAAPALVQATTAAPTTHVSVTWSAVSGASWYMVEFAQSISGPFSELGQPTNSLFAAHDVAPSAVPVAYVYRVRSLDANYRKSSALSPMDFAVTATTLFSDEPIEKGHTFVKSIHIVELRNAIDKARLAANKPQLWQGAPAPSGLIAATPITSLLAGLNEVRAVFQLPPFAYSSGIAMPQSGGRIVSEHIQEVRNALR